MATSNSPMRLDPELTAAARSTAESMSRSLSQQIAHWARIGRELERSPGVTVSAIQAVLDGRGDYDALNSHEQAVVRVGWAERIDDARKNLRLDQILAAKGREVVELNSEGKVTVRKAGSRGRMRIVK
ncbi:MAG: hypothetical protein C0434_02515 [Xanthomonadaceae bacterium]|nr:hypothetical protein [Xanthomonadaceae bacterium]